jgi:hypothetical protein
MSPGSQIPRLVHAGAHTYEVVDDIVSRYGALIRGRVLDSVTGNAMTGFSVSAEPADGLRLRNPEDGLFALAGVPGEVFPGGQGRTFKLTVDAPGYRPATRQVQVATGASFPVSTSPIRLEPLPVTVQGAVVLSLTNKTRQAGETVLLTGPGGARDLLGLGSPLRGSHSAAPPPAARVRGGTLALSIDSSRLRIAATAGAGEVDVVDRAKLTWAGPAPPLLALGAQRELAQVAQSGTGPGPVTLSVPLGRSFPAGTEVRAASFTALTSAPPGFAAAPALDADAEPGTSVIRLTQPLARAAVAVAIPDGAPTEYATVGSVTDGDGYYAFPGVAGVRRVELSVDGSTVPAEQLTVDYGRAVNVIDLRKQ